MNCKPGDMAIVVQGMNIGVIVEIICVSHNYGWPHRRLHSAWPARGCSGRLSANGAMSSNQEARLHPIARLRFSDGGVIMNAVAGVNC